jgi:alpha-ketoglutarate-dependent taurine dioxygenase
VKSVIRPTECGDTVFADTHAAYDALSEDLKTRLTGLTGNYCYLKLREVDNDGKAQNLDKVEVQSAAGCAVHPLITTHPITGHKNLYANPSHTASVIGMDSTSSEELLQTLFLHTAQPQFSYRHQYQDDDLILWDNRGEHLFFTLEHKQQCTMLILFFSCTSSRDWMSRRISSQAGSHHCEQRRGAEGEH